MYEKTVGVTGEVLNQLNTDHYLSNMKVSILYANIIKGVGIYKELKKIITSYENDESIITLNTNREFWFHYLEI